MAFGKIRSAGLVPGKIVPLVLNMLPGEPVVWLEHLGDTNESLMNDEIAKANGKATLAPGKGQLTKAKLAEVQEKRRITLQKHAIRKLEAVHDDGKAATAADIPEFCESLPGDVVDMVWTFANNAENWRERTIDGDPKEIAEK